MAKKSPSRHDSKRDRATVIDDEQQALQDELNEAAEKFANEYAAVTDEKSEGQNFMRDLCRVYRLESRHAVRFEHRVKGAGRSHTNFVDGFFPGLLLVEMKTAGKDLDAAYAQACGYVAQLKKAEEKPLHILVSDFQNLHLYDEHPDPALRRAPVKFKLAEFRQHVNVLDFLLGYERLIAERQEKASIEAARRLGELHDAVKATGYKGQDLQSLLVRLLFCMFADDTGLFDPSGGDATPFAELMKGSLADGSNLSHLLDLLFASLDTEKKLLAKKKSKRDPGAAGSAKDIYAMVDEFPYVNGTLFAGRLANCRFTPDCRAALLHCCNLDWSEISPDIFGTLFQHIMHWDNEDSGGKTRKRREFGAHYTSERNILRAIRPLFLDDLAAELEASKGDVTRLKAFHAKLGSLKILDPACGCGNFLVVAYRELRLLEQRVLDALVFAGGGQLALPVCDVHQFFGIEIDPTAVEIATVAMWLTDHQMNMRLKVKPRIPLNHKANVVCANALRVNWNDVLPAIQCSFVVGNPPFIGKQFQSIKQKADMLRVFGEHKNFGLLDYVAAWYFKALKLLQSNSSIKVAFVSTNSITQGEQVAVLWPQLLQAGVAIHFAHRTFRWTNEGSGLAAVHCVIIGFGLSKPSKCHLWHYGKDLSGEPTRQRAMRINPYLVDAPVVTLVNRRQPICAVPRIAFGNMPNDGGNLLLDDAEKKRLLIKEPAAATWIKPIVSAREFLNNEKRWCLWLTGPSVSGLDSWESLSEIVKRVDAVRAYRTSSTRASTVDLADTPHLFGEIRQPSGHYILIPRVSSESRAYVPMGFFSETVIVSDTCLSVNSHASLYHFGILSSTMHNAWLRSTGGRLKSDYRYSAGIVYNNYPWPSALSAGQQLAIEVAAQALLDARTQHADKSLAWMYKPETMPANVQAAHDLIDVAVDAAYAYEVGEDDAPRVAFLFKRYQELTSLLPQDDEAIEGDRAPVKSIKRRRTK